MYPWERPAPHADFAADAAAALAEIRAAVAQRGRPHSDDFEGREIWTASWGRRNERGLHKAALVGSRPVYTKCAWCERRRDWRRELDVEHYRPRVKVTEWAGPPCLPPPLVADEPPPERTVGPGYWWLAFVWENLSLACKTCNAGWKRCLFPIVGPRPPYAEGMEHHEDVLLIEPGSLFHPGEHFRWTADGIMGDVSDRGYATIVTCGLNRGELIALRQKAAQETLEAVNTVIRGLRWRDGHLQRLGVARLARIGSREAEFTSMVRWITEDRLRTAWGEIEGLPD